MQTILPRPKAIAASGGFLTLGVHGHTELRCEAALDTNGGLAVFENALRRLTGAGFSDAGRYLLRVEPCAPSAFPRAAFALQAYQLTVAREGVTVRAAGAAGAGYALHTLSELLETNDDRICLPLCEIADWPDLEKRGLFIEDWYGTDRMELADWKQWIDDCAARRFNTLNIGVYGCWSIRFQRELPEFSFLPYQGYPALRREQSILYYSPTKGGYVENRCLPPIYEQDFFGKLVRYGRERGVEVYPLFNALGHNTLIPRLYPEVSAKADDGTPVGYGFCTENERTYTLLFALFDEIIDRYLAPNGVESFHLGMDEIWKAPGYDTEQPLRETDPWCRCPRCAVLPQSERMLRHLLRCAKHLKVRGMRTIVVYYDYLEHFGLLNDAFLAMLADAGLDDCLMLDWWGYARDVQTIFQTTKPALGLRRTLMPTTGLFLLGSVDSYVDNILSHASIAGGEGAEGMKAYGILSRSYDRAYACLSECGWNAFHAPSREDFDTLYENAVFPGSSLAQEAFIWYNKLLEPSEMGFRTEADSPAELLGNVVNYLWYTYVWFGCEYPMNYPGRVFVILLSDLPKYQRLLRDVCVAAENAMEAFRKLKSAGEYDGALLTYYLTDCESLAVLSQEYSELLCLYADYEALRGSAEGEIASLCDRLRELIRQRETLMLRFETLRDAYTAPGILHGMSVYREYLLDMLAFLEKAEDAGMPSWNPCDTRALAGEQFCRLFS